MVHGGQLQEVGGGLPLAVLLVGHVTARVALSGAGLWQWRRRYGNYWKYKIHGRYTNNFEKYFIKIPVDVVGTAARMVA